MEKFFNYENELRLSESDIKTEVEIKEEDFDFDDGSLSDVNPHCYDSLLQSSSQTLDLSSCLNSPCDEVAKDYDAKTFSFPPPPPPFMCPIVKSEIVHESNINIHDDNVHDFNSFPDEEILFESIKQSKYPKVLLTKINSKNYKRNATSSSSEEDYEMVDAPPKRRMVPLPPRKKISPTMFYSSTSAVASTAVASTAVASTTVTSTAAVTSTSCVRPSTSKGSILVRHDYTPTKTRETRPASQRATTDRGALITPSKLQARLDDLNLSDDDSLSSINSSNELRESELELDSSDSENNHPIFNIREEVEVVEEEHMEDVDDEEDDVSEVEKVFKAKTGHVWSSCPEISARTRSRNIVTEGAKLNGAAAEASTPLECFDAYMQAEILECIVRYTNKFAREFVENVVAADKQIYKETDATELRALFGVLLAMGIYNDTKQDLGRLWNEVSGKSLYKSALSANRFKALLSLIRFDDRKARKEREQEGIVNPDKLEPLREIFDLINTTLRTNYTPGTNLYIDEMLCLFRGKAPFRVYIKSKPGKYGLLLRMLSDVDTKLILQIAPYGGPLGNIPSKKPQEVVMDLMTPYFETNRNLTTDRYYTSIPLATELYNKKITLVGTLNTCRKHLPEEVKVVANRELHSTLFTVSKKPTSGANIPILIASYVSKLKPPKTVNILSTMHCKFSVNEKYRGFENKLKKPEVIEFYNMTMGAVDTDDQMVRRMSCKRSTKRWPLSWFYSILDICALNAFLIYSIKDAPTLVNIKRRKHGVRVNFYESLAKQLIKPHAARRMEARNFSNALKSCITKTFPELLPPPPPPQLPQAAPLLLARKRCKICYESEVGQKKKNVKKVLTNCHKCSNPCCTTHHNATYECVSCAAE